MTTIRVLEISGVLAKLNKTALFSRAKSDATKLVKDYVDGNRVLANNKMAACLFFQLIKSLDSGALKHAALDKIEHDFPDVISSEKSKVFKFLRKRSKTPDEIELDFCRESLAIYRQMGLVSKSNYEKYAHSGNVHEIDKFLATVELKTYKQKLHFAENFVMNHKDNLGVVPPILLARAHESLKAKVINGVRGSTEDLLNNVVAQMDDWSAQFATYENVDNFRASSKIQKLANFTDLSNIARVYEGYRAVFEQRLTWFPKDVDNNNVLANELKRNIANIDRVMGEYDAEWGLNDFTADENAVLNRYEKYKVLVEGLEISDYTKRQIAKYTFWDKDCKNTPDRLNQIIQLARYEIVLKNMARVGKDLDSNKLESDFNNAVLCRLSDAAKGGALITDKAYTQARLDFVNQVADFAGRLNTKFESLGDNLKTDLLSRIFNPLQDMDNRANARFHDGANDKYNAKVEFFKRIFKTFANSCLTSAAITAIALGVASVAGIGLTASVAVVGVSSGIAMAYFQIKKWQKKQIAEHKECGIKELVKDKRMLAMLMTTGFAAVGMIFGAAGLTTVMAALGYGAIGIGATSNSVQIFNDAKANGLSNTMAASLAIGNMLAAAAGGIIGRGVVKSFGGVDVATGVDNSDNQVSQNDNLEQNQSQPVETAQTSQVEQTYYPESRMEYTQSGLDNAKRIANILYQDDLGQLQKHVEMVEQYNATHGTHIDPYRAAMLRADAGGHVPSNYEIAIDNNGGTRFTNGNVKVLGAKWLNANPDFSAGDIKAVADVFNGDVADEAGMKVIERLDFCVSEKNHVGCVPGMTESVHGINTYSDGTSAFENKIVMVPDEKVVPVVEQPQVVVDETPKISEPVKHDVSGGMGMFGMLYEKKKNIVKKLRERMGTFLDSMFIQRQRAA